MNKDVREEKPTEVAKPAEKVSPLQIKADSVMQDTLVEIVIQDYNRAKNYRETRAYGKDDKGLELRFDDWMKALKDLYYGNRKFKTVPWKFCSNRSMKIAMAIVEMLHSRMLSAVWNESRLRWKPGGVEDADKVDRINRLMFWWCMVKHRMLTFFDGWIKSVLGFGDVATKLGWEVKEFDTGAIDTIPIVDQLTGEPLVDPTTGQVATTQEKRIRREETTTAEIIAKEDIFLQPKAKSLEEDPVIIRHKYLYSQIESMSREGQVVNLDKVKENVDRYLDLPENTPENKKEVLKQVRRRNQPVEAIEWYGKYDIDNDNFEEDIRLMVDPVNKVYLGGVPMTVLTKNGKRPLDYTKFNNRLECPEELEGLGVLEQIKELAEEIDACFNQFTDANTLSIMRPGFYDPAGDVDAPTITLAPNKITPVSNPTRNIFFPDMQIDTTRMINAIKLVLEFIERLTGASSYIMGKESEIVGGSGTATRTQAIVQASEQRFSTPAQRLQAGASRILTKILDQIQLNIPPGLEQRVLGEKNEMLFKQNELTEEGISGEFDAFLLEDVSMGDKNMARQLADYLYQALMQNPLIIADPMKIDKITRDLIEAYQSEVEAVELLGPKMERKDFDTPEEENTLMVQGDFNKVRALMPENHLYHLMSHQEFLSSPSFATMPKGIADQVYQFAMAHIQEHQNFMMQNMQNMLALKGGMGGQSGQTSPMQGNASVGGMGPASGVMGQVLSEKRAGQSGPTQNGAVSQGNPATG